MRITDIFEKTVATTTDFRADHREAEPSLASVLAIHTDAVEHGRKLVGLAVDSASRFGQAPLLRTRFIPRLLSAAPESYADPETGGIDPAKVHALLLRPEPPGRHGERAGAIGLIDAALWDLTAKWHGEPLWRTLARLDRWQGNPCVAVYGSGGHYPSTPTAALLQDEIAQAYANGHRCYKIKLLAESRADDLRRLEVAKSALPGGKVAVDFNCHLSREMAQDYAKALLPLEPAWVEDLFDPFDFDLYRTFAQNWPGSIATGENLHSMEEARCLLRHAGLRPDRDRLNMDISLSYGIVEYRRILALLESHGWSRSACFPHVGHILALNVAAGLGLGGCELSGRKENLFSALPEGVGVADGHVVLGTVPGVGIESTPQFFEHVADLL